VHIRVHGTYDVNDGFVLDYFVIPVLVLFLFVRLQRYPSLRTNGKPKFSCYFFFQKNSYRANAQVISLCQHVDATVKCSILEPM